MNTKTGESRTRPSPASATSSIRLTRSEDRQRRGGGRPMSGNPSRVWICARGSTAVNSLGTTSICTRRSFARRTSSMASSTGRSKNAITTRSTSSSTTISDSSSGGPRTDRPLITSVPRAVTGSTKPTTLTPYSGWSRTFRATSLATSSTPTMTAFCTYESRVRANARAPTRARATRTIASAQKVRSFGGYGFASPVTQEPAKKKNVPTVTRLNTPTRSSRVEWLARSSSRS